MSIFDVDTSTWCLPDIRKKLFVPLRLANYELIADKHVPDSQIFRVTGTEKGPEIFRSRFQLQRFKLSWKERILGWAVR